ncbi:hypothetical protein V2A28_05840 [Pseudomonas aeruginosa]|uniref:hypothetical protein n=1 Tax=Pseudomonas aeruginosa group TaxID=136841 RepID=UPI00070C74BE|nr:MULTISPECIES: hypothetical protein [Pseudomonas aeruginosa group]MDG9855621.1 hypothetical protein [Pseudomonas nitroreducens]
MPIFEVVSGGDRRSLIKRFERKSKHDAVSELVDFHLLNCTRIEKLEIELAAVQVDAKRYRWLRDPDRVPDDAPIGHLIVGDAEGEDILWREQLDRRIDRELLAEGKECHGHDD